MPDPTPEVVPVLPQPEVLGQGTPMVVESPAPVAQTETPAAAAVPVAEPEPELEALVELREDLRKRERPWHLGLRTLVFALSLAAFAWVMRDVGPVGVAIIVGVLLFHELGHYVAMKAFGYENMQVFFIPFLGAAVSGRARNPVGWQAGVVSLAGPVPGLLVGVALLPFVVPGTWQAMLVVTLVFVNGLNLLPMMPLDGGRLLGTVLFSRHPVLEFVAMIAGGIGLILVPGFDLPPAVVGGALVGMLFHRARVLEAAKPLRTSNEDFSGPASALSTSALSALLAAANQVLEKNAFVTRRGRASTVAEMQEVARLRPAGWRPSVVLFVAWALSAGLAYSTWDGYRNPTARWRDVEGPGRSWTARFPGRPVSRTLPAPGPGVLEVQQTLMQLGKKGEFGVVSAVLAIPGNALDVDPQRAMATMQAMAAESARLGKGTISKQTPMEWQGRQALETVIALSTGGSLELLHVASGNTVHVVVLAGVSDAEVRQQFREGFVLGEARPD